MSPAIVYLAARGNGEDFWVQLLVVVVLAAGWGAYSLFKTRTKKHRPLFEPAGAGYETQVLEQPNVKRRDLRSGMELLARDFLAGVVERTESVDQRDVTMRRLCFAELVRRGQLSAISGSALKVYTLNEDEFYDKSIRCEAMKELAGRTGKAPESTGAVEPQDAADEAIANADR